MKKVAIMMALVSTLALSACGIDTTKMSAIKEGVDMAKQIGEVGNQEGMTDQEKQNAAIDIFAGGIGEMMDGSEEELTDEEKAALMQGADMLKDNGAGVKAELDRQLEEMDDESAEKSE